MIHYNEDWTRRVEGHPHEVVHGPLNLINILDYWRYAHGKGETPHTIQYRAMKPIYSGETYEILTTEAKDSTRDSWTIIAEKDGITCMKAEIS